MAKCDYCGSTIIFDGKRDAKGRFCKKKCQGRGALLAISRQLPDSAVQGQVWKVHSGTLSEVQRRRTCGCSRQPHSVVRIISHIMEQCAPTVMSKLRNQEPVARCSL